MIRITKALIGDAAKTGDIGKTADRPEIMHER
jgi:hypothetical protein